jgi:hypothetical protein
MKKNQLQGYRISLKTIHFFLLHKFSALVTWVKSLKSHELQYKTPMDIAH